MSELAITLFRFGGIVLLLSTTACQEAIQPFDPKHEDLHYSLWGYLNASADTQWIRVSAVRKSVLTPPGDLDATLVLEHLESGDTYEMNDSVFRFDASEFFSGLEDGEDAVVHNYWTDVPIEFGETYRLSATGPEGKFTTATVRVPEDIESVDVRFEPFVGEFVRANDVEHMAMIVKREYLVDDPEECPPQVPHRWVFNAWWLEETEPGIWDVELPNTERLFLPCRVVNKDILVVSSGVQWIPGGIQFSVGAPTKGEFPSSVEDGLGHVAGIVSKVLPLEQCWTERPPLGLRDPCTLTYLDGTSASLKGTISAAVCGGGPAVRVQVDLRELPEDPAQPVLVRRTLTDSDGFYWMEAIHPERTYEIQVQELPADTVSFATDEHVTMDVAFEGFVPCED